MKFTGMILSVALLLVGTQAQAKYDPTWERPILTASDMVETDRFMNEVRSDLSDVTVTLHQRDGQSEPTLISLTASQPVFCVTAPCPPIQHKVEYQVWDVRDAGCGSRKYLGQAVSPGFGGGAQVRYVRIVDHSERRCKDLKPFTWEVTTQNPMGQRRYFGGEPEPVVTIQSAG